MTLVTQAEYARMREVSKKTVTKWKQDGKLILSDGMVDVEASDAYMKKYRSAGVTGNAPGNGKRNETPMSVMEDETPAEAANRIIEIVGADMTIEEAKRVKENYLALLSKLEHEIKSGSVVELGTAQAVLFECARAQRDSWLNWPSKVGPLLAADMDMEADKVTELLTAHVHAHIAELGMPESDFKG